MAKEATVDFVDLALGIEKVLGDVPAACTDGLERAARKSTRRTALALRGEFTEGIGRHPWSDEYRSGFANRVDRRVFEVTAEIGNRKKPGLVHLLEKGHATLTERRTQAYPHMAPAFDDMVEDFVERAKQEIERSL